MFKILWLTGESGAGKTTLAKAIQKEWPSLILDGDEMRKSISIESGYSFMDRAEHNYRVARLASVLVQQTNIIVAVIAPSKEVREEITKMCNPIWIYIKRDIPQREDHFYEVSLDYPMLDADALTVAQEMQFINNWVI